MLKHVDTGGFDFDAWAQLAQTDPKAFEIKRKTAIEEVISGATRRNRPRLRRMQWKLDRIRQVSPTPMAACIRMQALLWQSVLGEDGLLDRLQRMPSPEKPSDRSAQILEFRR